MRKYSLLLMALIGLFTLADAQWVQMGNDIDGSNINDYHGNRIALSRDGLTVAASASGSSQGLHPGKIRVYRWSGGNWNPLGGDINGDSLGEAFGSAVGISADGNTIVVGSQSFYINNGQSGRVQVFDWTGGSWSRRGLPLIGEDLYTGLGASVTISDDGNTIAAGGPTNQGNGPLAGHVQVFDWNGNAWSQRGADLDGQGGYRRFGSAVGMSADGNTVAVGAPLHNATGGPTGYLKIFEWSGSAWQPKGSNVTGSGTLDYFGSRIDLSEDGNAVIGGGPDAGINGSRSGMVKVAVWDGTAWQPRGGQFVGPGSNTYCGYSVSIAKGGDVMAFSIPGNTGTGGGGPGITQVYDWVAGAWQQRGVDLVGEANGDSFGRSIALSRQGDTLAVGARWNDGSFGNAGHIRVFAGPTCLNSFNSVVDTACNAYTSPSGQAWMTSGAYVDTIPNAGGCDSVISIDLTVLPLDSGISQNGNILFADATGVNYQWVDCNNANTPIPGETNQFYTPTSSGSYAVLISNGPCNAISDCVPVTVVGLQAAMNNGLSLFPNPATQHLKVAHATWQNGDITLVDLTGKMISRWESVQGEVLLDLQGLAPGIYFVEWTSLEGSAVSKFVIQR